MPRPVPDHAALAAIVFEQQKTIAKLTERIEVLEGVKPSQQSSMNRSFDTHSNSADGTSAAGSRAPRAKKTQASVKICRFGDSCARSDCWFEHPDSQSAGPSGSGNINQTSAQSGQRKKACNNGITCTRSNCWYEHPPGWNPYSTPPEPSQQETNTWGPAAPSGNETTPRASADDAWNVDSTDLSSWGVEPNNDWGAPVDDTWGGTASNEWGSSTGQVSSNARNEWGAPTSFDRSVTATPDGSVVAKSISSSKGKKASTAKQRETEQATRIKGRKKQPIATETSMSASSSSARPTTPLPSEPVNQTPPPNESTEVGFTPVKPPDTQDAQVAQATPGSWDAQNTKEVQDASSAQVTQDVQDIQDIQDVQDVQDVQDIRDVEGVGDTRGIQGIQDIQHAHDHDANDIQEADDVQDIHSVQDTQDLQGTQDAQNLHDLHKSQNGQEIQDSGDVQGTPSLEPLATSSTFSPPESEVPATPTPFVWSDEPDVTVIDYSDPPFDEHPGSPTSQAYETSAPEVTNDVGDMSQPAEEPVDLDESAPSVLYTSWAATESSAADWGFDASEWAPPAPSADKKPARKKGSKTKDKDKENEKEVEKAASALNSQPKATGVPGSGALKPKESKSPAPATGSEPTTPSTTSEHVPQVVHTPLLGLPEEEVPDWLFSVGEDSHAALGISRPSTSTTEASSAPPRLAPTQPPTRPKLSKISGEDFPPPIVVPQRSKTESAKPKIHARPVGWKVIPSAESDNAWGNKNSKSKK